MSINQLQRSGFFTRGAQSRRRNDTHCHFEAQASHVALNTRFVDVDCLPS